MIGIFKMEQSEDTILFYNQTKAYGQFSNFYPSVVEVDGTEYQTSEHYYQSQKFNLKPELKEAIINTKTPDEAAILARVEKSNRREDWDEVKDEIMYKAIKCKFEQNLELKAFLLDTENKKLIEHTKNDSYWADGGDGTGKNRLGELLMKLRDEFKADINE